LHEHAVESSKPLEAYRISVIGQRLKSHGFVVFLACMMLLKQLAWIHEIQHRHGPRAVLCLKQGLTILLMMTLLHGSC